MLKREGILFCICGPAGVGKSTVARYLVENYSEVEFSVSATSRPPRKGESDGVDYHFMSREEFERRISEGDFFEYEEVHGNYYGTLKSSVEGAITAGTDLLLDIDIKGALTFKRKKPDNTVIVFMVPPSLKELISRIKYRGSISDEELSRRLKTLEEEYRILFDLGKENIDYLVVNAELSETCDLVSYIFQAERMKLKRLERASIKAFLGDLS
ncbi:MAG: guanylate kinase [Candidatus Dadabacteria bacterium]|nr:MAG: guanylate kinase [Candidatus Dadabacteria bacterium]